MSAHTVDESTAVSDAAAATQGPREYLTLRLGEEEYGIDILRVQEIRGYEKPTRIVGAPHFVLGVQNLRGLIVPIVDLRARFAIEAGFDALTVTVVLNVAGRTVGAVVDSVSDVLELSPQQIKPAPGFNGAFDASHITGLGSVCQGQTERMVVLLDIERLIASEELGFGQAPVH